MSELQLPEHSGVAAVGLQTGYILPQDDIAAVTAEAVAPVAVDGDIVCVTEAVVARSQNRYVSVEELARELRQRLELSPGSTVAVVSPIGSRNRFALILRAVARAVDKGRVLVQLNVPYDEVGNPLVDVEFASNRLRFKKILQSLRDARGNSPHLNVLIREILAALKVQELGYQVQGIRKITGQGIADLTLIDPGGRLVVAEVTFAHLEKAATKALEIMEDEPRARQALALNVNLEHRQVGLVDARAYLDRKQEPVLHDFSAQLLSYYEPEVIYQNELGDAVFPHPITGVDYRHLYLEEIDREGARGEVVFTNNPLRIFDMGSIDGVCIGAVHERGSLLELFESFGAAVPVVSLDQWGPEPWGVIGSNVSDYESGVLKLLPASGDATCDEIRQRIKENTGHDVQVMIFGDGAYKDPETGIYELADPHPCLGASEGLRGSRLRTGTKLKLQIDTLHRQGHSREEIREILARQQNDISRESLGTTPRGVTSILGSLADLVAGSADAGTPVVLVRGFSLDGAGS